MRGGIIRTHIITQTHIAAASNNIIMDVLFGGFRPGMRNIMHNKRCYRFGIRCRR